MLSFSFHFSTGNTMAPTNNTATAEEKAQRAAEAQEIIDLLDSMEKEEADQIQKRQDELSSKAREIYDALVPSEASNQPIQLDVPEGHPEVEGLKEAMAAVQNALDKNNDAELVYAVTKLGPIVERQIKALLQHMQSVNSRLEQINGRLTSFPFTLFTRDTVDTNKTVIGSHRILLPTLESFRFGNPEELQAELSKMFSICRRSLGSDYDTLKVKTMGDTGTRYLDPDSGEEAETFTFKTTETMVTTLLNNLRIPHLPNIDIREGVQHRKVVSASATDNAPECLEADRIAAKVKVSPQAAEDYLERVQATVAEAESHQSPEVRQATALLTLVRAIEHYKSEGGRTPESAECIIQLYDKLQTVKTDAEAASLEAYAERYHAAPVAARLRRYPPPPETIRSALARSRGHNAAPVGTAALLRPGALSVSSNDANDASASAVGTITEQQTPTATSNP